MWEKYKFQKEFSAPAVHHRASVPTASTVNLAPMETYAVEGPRKVLIYYTEMNQDSR